MKKDRLSTKLHTCKFIFRDSRQNNLAKPAKDYKQRLALLKLCLTIENCHDFEKDKNTNPKKEGFNPSIT